MGPKLTGGKTQGCKGTLTIRKKKIRKKRKQPKILVWVFDRNKDVGELLTRGPLAPPGEHNFLDLCKMMRMQNDGNVQMTAADLQNCPSHTDWKSQKKKELLEANEANRSDVDVEEMKLRWNDLWQQTTGVLLKYYALVHQAGLDFIEDQGLTDEEKDQRKAFLDSNLDCYYRKYTVYKVISVVAIKCSRTDVKY